VGRSLLDTLGMDVRWELSLRLGLGLVASLMLAGCGKEAPASNPPVVESEEATTTAPELRPGEVVHAYQGRAEEEDDEADDDDEAGDDDDAGSEPPAADDGRLDAVELLALANAALDEVLDPYAPRVVTPLLPSEWPPTSGRVMVLAYPMAPLESGVTRYSLFAATHRVMIDVNDGTVTTEALGTKKGKKLGAIEKTRERSDDPIHAAEQALVDVVAGRRPPEKARMMLYPYGEWVDGHGAVGKDVEGRVGGLLELVRGGK
jgi:hypothetical protein